MVRIDRMGKRAPGTSALASEREIYDIDEEEAIGRAFKREMRKIGRAHV